VSVQAAWRRDQGGEVVAELQRGERQRGASVALGPGTTIDDLLLPVARRDLLDALKGKR
jgi:hypothetical protein